MKTEKKCILVVDDTAANTRLLKRYLEQTNDYVVGEENDATAAISKAEEFQPPPDPVGCDDAGLEGGELAARFRSSPKLKAVPIVFLMSAVTKGEVDAGDGRLGGYAFLAKPVVLSEVAACLKQHLA